ERIGATPSQRSQPSQPQENTEETAGRSRDGAGRYGDGDRPEETPTFSGTRDGRDDRDGVSRTNSNWQDEVAGERQILRSQAANCADADLASKLNALANEELQSVEEALAWHDRQSALEAEWRRQQQSAATVNGQCG